MLDEFKAMMYEFQDAQVATRNYAKCESDKGGSHPETKALEEIYDKHQARLETAWNEFIETVSIEFLELLARAMGDATIKIEDGTKK